jgi:EpsI family protein
MLNRRLLVAETLLIAGMLAMHSVTPAESPRAHRPLSEFPAAISIWRSEELPFEPEVVAAIGADDYLNREYFGADRPVELFIGYYRDQRSGEAIHSPRNCLPGEGWEAVKSTQLSIGTDGNRVMVNEYLVEKGMERDLVLYWYQNHGRIVASEYRAKFWLVADGLRRRGTDGAMIRIWTTAEDGEKNAQARAVEFAQRIYPEIKKFLPNEPVRTAALKPW